MLASSRLFVVIGVVACTTPGESIERHIERGLAGEFGITASVRCPSMIVTLPEPGDTMTCEMTHGGESFNVRANVDERKHLIISVSTTDAVLFPISLLESRAGVQLQCPTEHHLRVTLAKPSYCKVVGTDEYLRIKLEDIESEKWFHTRFDAKTPAQDIFARIALEATITCNAVELVDAAPATCDVKTKSGEQFQLRYKLGESSMHFVRDGLPVVMLPAVVTTNATPRELPLRCPRRVVRPDEAVRCAYVHDGKQSWVNVAVDAKGNSRLL
jgi:hypothetical protein